MSDSVTTLEHAPTASSSLTPLEIVEALDKHIIGQHKAKRSVAVAPAKPLPPPSTARRIAKRSNS